MATKRFTVALPDDLERDLNQYLEKLDTEVSLTALAQEALRQWLKDAKWRERVYRTTPKSFMDMPVSPKGSGKTDISKNHDKYLAEGLKKKLARSRR